jgi:hypothetical protein
MPGEHSVIKCTKNGVQGWKNTATNICFTGSGAKAKATEQMQAILIRKQKDSAIIYDRASILKATIDEVSGFLTAPVTLARVGVQYYQGWELGLTDRAMDRIGVYRSPEEVFNQESINTFVNMVVTDEHPSELITTDNVKKFQIGTVSQVTKSSDGKTLEGLITITDKTKIEEIKNTRKTKDKKIEVSVGYLNELVQNVGVDSGNFYEYSQTGIKGNHLAIVDKGRCGSDCSIILDKKGGEHMVITIDDIDFNIEDTQLAQAILKQQKSFDAKIKWMKNKMDEKDQETEEEMEKMKKEKEEMKKEKDKADAAKDALSTQILDTEKINKMVSDRAALLVEASAILKDKMLECIDCPREIKAAVIDHVLDLGDLSAKSDDYINASYDLAIKMHKNAKNSLSRLSNDLKINDQKIADRETGRIKYIKDFLKVDQV